MDFLLLLILILSQRNTVRVFLPRPLPFSQNWCGAHYVAIDGSRSHQSLPQLNHASSCLMCYVQLRRCQTIHHTERGCANPKKIQWRKALIMHLNHVAFLKDSRTLLHMCLTASFLFSSFQRLLVLRVEKVILWIVVKENHEKSRDLGCRVYQMYSTAFGFCKINKLFLHSSLENLKNLLSNSSKDLNSVLDTICTITELTQLNIFPLFSPL